MVFIKYLPIFLFMRRPKKTRLRWMMEMQVIIAAIIIIIIIVIINIGRRPSSTNLITIIVIIITLLIIKQMLLTLGPTYHSLDLIRAKQHGDCLPPLPATTHRSEEVF